MNLLFYAGHPAQYHFLKYIIRELRKKGHKVHLLIKAKDVLEELLIEDKVEFINILPEGRKDSKIQILLGLFKRDLRLFRYAKNKKFDLFIGTDPSLSHIGRLLRIPVITVLEDDIDVIPSLARLTFPFTTHIVTPQNVKVGRFTKKQICYDGYMKLAYLHPQFFQIKVSLITQPYYLLRLSKLNAYHDIGISGLREAIIDRLISILSETGNVYISSEKSIPLKYKSHQLSINSSEMHSFLASASLLISDSQSMTVEASMLGVPSVRFSDFAGKISVLEELEHKYQLTFGYLTSESDKMLSKVMELISTQGLKKTFQNRRSMMLSEKINVTEFMVWLIENYPESAYNMQLNPDFQNRFR